MFETFCHPYSLWKIAGTSVLFMVNESSLVTHGPNSVKSPVAIPDPPWKIFFFQKNKRENSKEEKTKGNNYICKLLVSCIFTPELKHRIYTHDRHAPYRASLVPNRDRVVLGVVLTFDKPVVDKALPVCDWNVSTPLIRRKVVVPS